MHYRDNIYDNTCSINRYYRRYFSAGETERDCALRYRAVVQVPII